MNKIFHIGSTFKSFEENDDLFIRGMASTSDRDRVGDIVESSAWSKGGLKNYLNNPVILFNHNYNQPIGRAVELSTDDKGLQLKAKIAKSAGNVRELIKEGVLGAFSVGFQVKDAEYDSETDGYTIKDAELLEVSVVSVPANQAATFSLAKSFDSMEEYEEFKKTLKDSFPVGNESIDLEKVKAQEKTMSDIDINAIVAAAVEKTATAMAMKEAERKAEEQRKQEAAQKAAKAEEQRKAEQQATIVSAVQSGTEKLLAEVERKLAEKDADYSRIIGELSSELKEKSEEISKIRESKRVFSDREVKKNLAEYMEEAKDAYILGKVTRKGWDTKLGREFLQKAVNDNAGVAVPVVASAEPYELEVLTSVERDIELQLVLEPLFRRITMNAATMVIPTMPDAGYAEILSGSNGTGTGSPPKGNLTARGGGDVDMGSKTLTTKKIVSKSFITNEVEEDAIMPVLPFIREAMVRSHARTIEHTLLMGGHPDCLVANSYTGLLGFAEQSSPTQKIDMGSGSPGAGQYKAADLLNLRQAMGKYGRNPSDLVYIVSLAAYYDLLDDTEFDDVNQVGIGTATKLSGQLGAVYGTPIIVCDEFPAKADGKPCAVAVNTRHFIIPVLRGMTVESDYDVEAQRRVLVSTARRGFDHIFGADDGQVIMGTW